MPTLFRAYAKVRAVIEITPATLGVDISEACLLRWIV